MKTENLAAKIRAQIGARVVTPYQFQRMIREAFAWLDLGRYEDEAVEWAVLNVLRDPPVSPPWA